MFNRDPKRTQTKNSVLKSLKRSKLKDSFNIKGEIDEDQTFKKLIKTINKQSKTNQDMLFIYFYLIKLPNLIESFRKNTNLDKVNNLIKEISMAITVENVYKNSVLFKIGEVGYSFYMILKGEVNVLITDQVKVNTKSVYYIKHMYKLYK